MAFLAVSEARIASPKKVASQGEATVLALPLKASLALHNRVFSLSEIVIASLLALSGASFLAPRLRLLALNSALVLTLRLRTDSGSKATLATLLAHRGALGLASRDRRG